MVDTIIKFVRTAISQYDLVCTGVLWCVLAIALRKAVAHPTICMLSVDNGHADTIPTRPNQLTKPWSVSATHIVGSQA